MLTTGTLVVAAKDTDLGELGTGLCDCTNSESITIDGMPLDGVLPDVAILIPETVIALEIERGRSARTIKISLVISHP